MKASKMKKVMAWILTVLMLFSMFGGTALAEENGEGGAEDSTAGYTPINTYVLTYEGEGAKPYLYGSRFEYKHSYNDPDAGENSVWTYWNCPEIFNLVNATDGSSIAAYCTDADTSTRSNATYQRMNLEDSTYHASGAADRLRAVLLNSFPKKSVEEVVTAVTQANLTVTNLQLGELISATQQAIWEISHGDKYTVDVRYTGIREESEYDKNEFVYPESLNATHTEYTGSNMETLYQYFINMAGVPATEQVLTSAAFADKNMYIVNHSDGTQQSVINAVINVQMKDGTDSLTVSAVVNGQVLASQALVNGENKVTLTLPGQADSVMLAIDGTQTVAGVYLFDALGERTESQSMVGYDDSSLPVHAETTVTPDNAISITKITTTTEKNAEDQEVTVEHPLEGIEFDIYYVCDV
ncbi:MAG: thioester domain-containing protein, partial [Lachnospiraceae bacterium]|nr:thioester domain-containing protein [Lachnospiraceae bacterium]